jgi:hypothetical protein
VRLRFALELQSEFDPWQYSLGNKISFRKLSQERHPTIQGCSPPFAASAGPDPHGGGSPFDDVSQADLTLDEKAREVNAMLRMFRLQRLNVLFLVAFQFHALAAEMTS